MQLLGVTRGDTATSGTATSGPEPPKLEWSGSGADPEIEEGGGIHIK